MPKKVLFCLIFVLALLLLLAGCGKADSGRLPVAGNGNYPPPEQQSEAGSEQRPEAEPEQRPEQQPVQQEEAGGGQPAGNNNPGTPDVVIRTDNPVSSQEADAMLDAVDRQLTELLETLDQLDDIELESLEFEGDGLP